MSDGKQKNFNIKHRPYRPNRPTRAINVFTFSNIISGKLVLSKDVFLSALSPIVQNISTITETGHHKKMVFSPGSDDGSRVSELQNDHFITDPP